MSHKVKDTVRFGATFAHVMSVAVAGATGELEQTIKTMEGEIKTVPVRELRLSAAKLVNYGGRLIWEPGMRSAKRFRRYCWPEPEKAGVHARA